MHLFKQCLKVGPMLLIMCVVALIVCAPAVSNAHDFKGMAAGILAMHTKVIHDDAPTAKLDLTNLSRAAIVRQTQPGQCLCEMRNGKCICIETGKECNDPNCIIVARADTPQQCQPGQACAPGSACSQRSGQTYNAGGCSSCGRQRVGWFGRMRRR